MTPPPKCSCGAETTISVAYTDGVKTWRCTKGHLSSTREALPQDKREVA